MQLWSRLEAEDFEELLLLVEPRCGLRAVLAIHDSTSGPAFGGIRRASYASEGALLEDALRLARAMSRKCSLAGLPAGGAKMVLWDRPALDVPAAYRAVGDLLERLGGRWFAGPDAGTGFAELDHVAARTRFVTRRPPAGPGRLAEATAAGVHAGILAALEALDGRADVRERQIVVQGLGAVGSALAERLLAEGARVTASDPRPEAGATFAASPNFRRVAPGEELLLPCDLFAPCALGGVLDDAGIRRLGARTVCGAANNPCLDTRGPALLHERGILLVPDVAVTSGAVLRGVEHELARRLVPPEEVEERVGRVVRGVLDAARAEGRPPQEVALRMADERLSARRTGRGPCDRPPGVVSGSGP